MPAFQHPDSIESELLNITAHSMNQPEDLIFIFVEPREFPNPGFLNEFLFRIFHPENRSYYRAESAERMAMAIAYSSLVRVAVSLMLAFIFGWSISGFRRMRQAE